MPDYLTIASTVLWLALMVFVEARSRATRREQERVNESLTRTQASLRQAEMAMARIRGGSMTHEEREEQRRSFAYGNANLANEAVTREMVDDAADAEEKGTP